MVFKFFYVFSFLIRLGATLWFLSANIMDGTDSSYFLQVRRSLRVRRCCRSGISSRRFNLIVNWKTPLCRKRSAWEPSEEAWIDSPFDPMPIVDNRLHIYPFHPNGLAVWPALARWRQIIQIRQWSSQATLNLRSLPLSVLSFTPQ